MKVTLSDCLNDLANATGASNTALVYANDVNDAYSNAGIGTWFSPEYYTTFSQANISDKLFTKNLNPAREQAKFWQALGKGQVSELVNDYLKREQKLFAKTSKIDMNALNSYVNSKNLEDLMNNIVIDFALGASNPLMQLSAVMQHVVWTEYISEFEPFRLDENHKKYAGKLLVPYDELAKEEQLKDNVIIASVTDRLMQNAGFNESLRIRNTALRALIGPKMFSQDR